MDPAQAKQQLRLKVGSLKKSYSAETLQTLSEVICTRLMQSPLVRAASRIACYYALPDEVQTANFIEKCSAHKVILLPVVDGKRLRWFPYLGKDKLQTGAFGIMEPQTDSDEITTENIDIAIVPGIAFDRQRNRLGHGKGFYDRAFATFDKPTIGLCFGFQLFDAIPADIHDRKMTQIITENEIIA